jgi:hypothetical protein
MNASSSPSNWLLNDRTRTFFCIAVAVLLTALLSFRLTAAPNKADGHQNLHAAYNLAYHGVISLKDNLKPSNYREPLPIAALALHIKLHPELSGGQDLTSINHDSAVLAVKQHNLIWAFFCLFGVGCVGLQSSRMHWVGFSVAIIAVGLTCFLFLQRSEIIDRTYTEVQAATLLVWSSFALIRALQTKMPVWFATTGLLMGALALTKAIFLYVGIGLAAALLVLCLLWRPMPRARSIALVSLMSISMALIVLPWMTRNWLQFGSMQITQRGGVVLMMRAYYDRMNDVEYKGAFYHVARSSSLKELVGTYLGFSQKDLELGGRLQRLNRDGSSAFAASDKKAEKEGRPDEAVSFYRAARAERSRLGKYFSEQGVPNASHAADKELQKRAIAEIITNPIKHLKVAVLFLWQAMSLGPLGFIAIWIMAFVGVLRGSAFMTGLALVPAGTLVFLSLTAHLAPRLIAPLVPNMVVAAVVLVAWIVQVLISSVAILFRESWTKVSEGSG